MIFFHFYLGICPVCEISDKIKKKKPINAARMIQNISTTESRERKTVRRHISWAVIKRRKLKELTSVVLQCRGVHKDWVHVVVVVLVVQHVFRLRLSGVLHCLSVRWCCVWSWNATKSLSDFKSLIPGEAQATPPFTRFLY